MLGLSYTMAMAMWGEEECKRMYGAVVDKLSTWRRRLFRRGRGDNLN